MENWLSRSDILNIYANNHNKAEAVNVLADLLDCCDFDVIEYLDLQQAEIPPKIKKRMGWTPDEDAALAAMVSEGLRTEEIIKRLGKTRKRVVSRKRFLLGYEK